MSLESQVAGLVESSTKLTEVVSGKVREIDDRVAQAGQDVASFVASHLADDSAERLHKYSLSENVLRNSGLQLNSDGVPYQWGAGNITVSTAADLLSNFIAWPDNASDAPVFKKITGMYDAETTVSEDMTYGQANLFGVNALKLVNDTPAVGVFGQKAQQIRRRDSSGDYFSRVFLKVVRGGVQFIKSYAGYEKAYSKWLCAPGFYPSVPSVSGSYSVSSNRLAGWRLELNDSDAYMVQDHMVSAHDGYFRIYMHPGTEIIIAAPTSFMSCNSNPGDVGFAGLNGRMLTVSDTDGTMLFL